MTSNLELWVEKLILRSDHYGMGRVWEVKVLGQKRPRVSPTSPCRPLWGQRDRREWAEQGFLKQVYNLRNPGHVVHTLVGINPIVGFSFHVMGFVLQSGFVPQRYWRGMSHWQTPTQLLTPHHLTVPCAAIFAELSWNVCLNPWLGLSFHCQLLSLRLMENL